MFSRITARPLPDTALLLRYRGDYTDCFATEFDAPVSLEAFVRAFYTSWLFRLERWILAWLVGKPSSDDEAAALASGRADAFAAWQVEDRQPDQLLMSDFRGQTRSWFMVVPSGASTRLLFGSAVTAGQGGRLTGGYRLLLPLHRLYSRLLLRAASGRLAKIPDHS